MPSTAHGYRSTLRLSRRAAALLERERTQPPPRRLLESTVWPCPKLSYADTVGARAALLRMQHEPSPPEFVFELEPYQCIRCDRWHLGHMLTDADV